MSPAALIGIDLGTSNCKAAAFDEQGRLLAIARQPIETHAPGPDLAEQDVAAWRQAVAGCLHQLRAQATFNHYAIAGLGITGHFPSLALLGPEGEPLRPAIIWKDSRGILPAHLPGPEVAKRTRLPVSYLNTLPLAKLFWLKHHEPACLDSARLGWCLGAKDTIVFYLTGRAVTDPIEAWWTGLAGQAGQSWDEKFLEQAGVPADCLPEILPMTALAGGILPTAADQTGLAAGTPVVVGTGDGVCGMLGAGVLQPGQGAIMSGSSLIVAAPVSERVIFAGNESIVRLPSALDAYDVLYTSTLCGSAFTFVFNLLGEHRWRDIQAQALRAAPRPDDPLFIPHLEGITSPIVNPNLRGAWLGLASGQDWPELYRGVEESIAFCARQILDAFREQGVTLPAVRLAGGGAQERSAGQLYADALGQPVARLVTSEVGCLGAAALAAVAARIYPDITAAIAGMVVGAEVIEPGTNQAVSEKRYQRFCEASAWLNGWSS